MDNTLKNLEDAYSYWLHAGTPHTILEKYVVAMADGMKVLDGNTDMMLTTGTCSPREFTAFAEADAVAKEMEYRMQEEGPVTVMTHDAFCSIQAMRYSAALRAVRVANAMARRPVAA